MEKTKMLEILESDFVYVPEDLRTDEWSMSFITWMRGADDQDLLLALSMLLAMIARRTIPNPQDASPEVRQEAMKRVLAHMERKLQARPEE